LLQLGFILVAARAAGFLLRRLHQPQVVGEMLAGVLLGPSLLGWLFPRAAATLFPPESLGFLSAVSHVGVVLFMFIMGLEVDHQLLRARGRAAVVTSQAGILVPFVLGSLLGLFLYPRLAEEGVAKIHFVLFMGTAMSITAFPVLARILSERGMAGTNVGTMALACAAAGDVVGWAILAVVVLLARSVEFGASLGLIALGLGGLAGAMWFVARPIVVSIVDVYDRRGFLSNDMIAVVLLLVLAAAWGGEVAGVHSLFGAFVLGVLVPRHSDFARAIIGKIQDLTVVLLLPTFFALTGLRTKIGLISGAEMWACGGVVLLVAISGKFGGSAVAARLSGLSWREAGSIGVLMNTRGLMELIVLNVGLETGVISPSLFTIMVVMALVTTFMTAPILHMIHPRPQLQAEAPSPLVAKAV
jgi:Kef-type K+ transport system membrane component KefB